MRKLFSILLGLLFVPLMAKATITLPPTTTQGGILVGTSTTRLINLPVGLNGQVLTIDSTLFPIWKTPTSGGSFTTTTINGLSATDYTFTGTGVTISTSAPNVVTFTVNGGGGGGGAVGTSTIDYLAFYNSVNSVTGTQFVRFLNGLLSITTSTSIGTSTITYLNFQNATGTLLTVTTANITSGTVSYLNSTNVTTTGLTFTNLNGTNATTTNLNVSTQLVGPSTTLTRLNTGSATTTNLNASNLVFSTATGTSATTTNLAINGVLNCTATNQALQTKADGTINCGTLSFTFTPPPGIVATSTAGMFAYYLSATTVTGTQYVQNSANVIAFSTGTTFTTSTITNLNATNITSTQGIFTTSSLTTANIGTLNVGTCNGCYTLPSAVTFTSLTSTNAFFTNVSSTGATTTNLFVSGSLNLPANSVTDGMISSAATWNAKQNAITPGTYLSFSGATLNVTTTFVSQTITNLNATNVTSSNIVVSGVASQCLQTDANGKITGTGSACGSGGGGGGGGVNTSTINYLAVYNSVNTVTGTPYVSFGLNDLSIPGLRITTTTDFTQSVGIGASPAATDIFDVYGLGTKGATIDTGDRQFCAGDCGGNYGSTQITVLDVADGGGYIALSGQIYSGNRFGFNTLAPSDTLHFTGKGGITMDSPGLAGNPFYFYTGFTTATATAIVAQSKYLYIAEDNTATTSGHFLVVNAFDPPNLRIVGQVNISKPSALAVVGRYAYVLSQVSSSMYIVDISQPSVPSIISTTTIASSSAIYISGKYAYVTEAGANSTTLIVDISNPYAPVTAGTILGGKSVTSVYVQGRYAYLTNFTSNTMSVVDVSAPNNPVISGTLTGVNGAQAVYVSGPYAYVASKTDNLIFTVDITSSTRPIKVATNTIFAQPTNVVVVGKLMLVGTLTGEVHIYDVSSSTLPREVDSIGTGQPEVKVAIDGGYLYLTAERGAFYIWRFQTIEAQSARLGTVTVTQLDVSDNAIFGNNVSMLAGLTANGIYSYAPITITSSSSSTLPLFTIGNGSNTTFSIDSGGNTSVSGTLRAFGTSTLATTTISWLTVGSATSTNLNVSSFFTFGSATGTNLAVTGQTTLGTTTITTGTIAYINATNVTTTGLTFTNAVGTTSTLKYLNATNVTSSNALLAVLNFTSATGTNLSLSGAFNFANATGTNLFVSGSSTFGTGTTTWQVFTGGHVNTTGTIPTLSSCGTNPSVTGTDMMGTITPGATATACTMTFQLPYVNNHCVANEQTGSVVNAFSYSYTTTSLTLSQTGLAGAKVDYYCMDNK